MNTPVEHVIKTIQNTMDECERATQRSAFDSNIRLLEPSLRRVLDRLELLADVDKDDMLSRLETITVGNSDEKLSVLSRLDMDMKTIHAYLLSANSTGSSESLEKVDLKIYTEVLDRYGEVLKTVMRRNMMYVSVPLLLSYLTDHWFQRSSATYRDEGRTSQ
jgi:hypothetical protein